MPHVFLFLTIIIGLIYGVFQLFFYAIDSFVLIDENFVSNVKEKNNTLLNFFLIKDEETLSKNDKNDEKDNEKDNEKDKRRIKLKRINIAIGFDFFISSLLSILWFCYPFMLMQLTEYEMGLKSQNDKYIGKWLALMLLFTNIISLKYIKDGKLFSKQFLLLVKLLCSIVILITTLMIVIFTKKLYVSNIINVILTSLWMANSAVGLFISYSEKNI